MMALNNLHDLLQLAAEDPRQNGITVYPTGGLDHAITVSYSDLRERAIFNARVLTRLDRFSVGSVILLHFKNHLDGIIWFWSVLFSGCIPAMSTPFSNDLRQREKHLSHLKNILKDPICITTRDSVGEFGLSNTLHLEVVEDLVKTPSTSAERMTQLASRDITSQAIAMLMLTSGSTGQVKAVALRHDQLLASVRGKASVRSLPPDRAFLFGSVSIMLRVLSKYISKPCCFV